MMSAKMQQIQAEQAGGAAERQQLQGSLPPPATPPQQFLQNNVQPASPQMIAQEVQDQMNALKQDPVGLPAGWHSTQASNGKTYFYNDQGQTSWDMPGGGGAASAASTPAVAASSAASLTALPPVL